MGKNQKIASLIFAAGKGSRVKGYEGNKTLLPLVPKGGEVFQGDKPILLIIIDKLPQGPKAIVVNHKKEDVIRATGTCNAKYYEQPELNGTGGALLAARDFIKNEQYDSLLITMGDTPLIKASTFQGLVDGLSVCDLTILGFAPRDKKKYGVLDIEGNYVKRIVEWEYWHKFPAQEQERLSIVNGGIYAVKKDALIKYLELLSAQPHIVIKEREGKQVEVKEYFITDMVEMMYNDGLKTGYVVAADEDEVMGIDDVDSLKKAQGLYENQ
ncbi:MAG: NTP transferase domain-containing protein [Deltaproteobacteria bacterium]|nr:NTP transferase domain-containing protein [Deltaproteobacteria bacterium]